jgi:small subunit ribosomal protein S6
MTLPAPTYDLVLLLDPATEEATRKKIVADARATIEGAGEFLRHDEWGDRTLAYPIDKKAVAEYHLLQFHAGTPELLQTLDRTLRIIDDILRFRIIKLKPGVPEAPQAPAASTLERQPEPEATVPAEHPGQDEHAGQADVETSVEGDLQGGVEAEVGEPA